MKHRSALALVAALAAGSAASRPARAVDPVESFRFLVTGNGFGFQVFDVNANAITYFLERPYRYMRPNPSNPDGEGLVRRDLAFDTYFGVRAGGASAWLGKTTPVSVEYVDQTNIIRSTSYVGDVRAESHYFAPYGFEGNGMVMVLRLTNEGGSVVDVSAFSIHNFKLGGAPNPDFPGANGEAIQMASGAAVETGPGGGAMVYAPIGTMDIASCAADAFSRVEGGQSLASQTSCSGNDQVHAFQRDLGSLAAGATATWGVAVLFDADGDTARVRGAWDAFAAGRDAETILGDALAEWEAWRTPPIGGLTADERKVWRQSEAVLRMGVITEPYTAQIKNHGMVLASLPPGGWHSGWVRDAIYAIVALARTGHYEEAKWALNFFLDADAGKYTSYFDGLDYRISTVRYFGNGEEEADYSGAPTRNIEIDGWGLFLWAARVYVDESGDVAWLDETTKKGDTVWEAMREGVAEPLVALIEPSGMPIADASIWEVHWGNRQHFAYTTATTARGLCDMAALARRRDDLNDRDRYKGVAEGAVAALRTHFTDQNGVLAGSIEKLAQGSNYRDGATVEAFTWNLIGPEDPIATATLDDFSYLLTPAGGYKRVEGSTDQYDTDEWILIDLRASDAFRRAGRDQRADQLLDWVTAQARVNYHLIPELYNTRTSSGAIGAYSGSIPMVGYGGGAYILTHLGRVGLHEHDDCGTVDPTTYADAGALDIPDAGASAGGDAGIGLGRTGTACVCNSADRAPGPGTLALALLVGAALVRRRRRA